ncbi:MAG TPA: 1-(5-phosphoribosyl)-5-[(5-phosphoribosylamino)methylideneamino]imidazole-4-carboxamide isomerase [Acidimicrobiia bacterium]|nr:1-(5-phosphoribosyl)-5-[(5-phosphoribosylamino)methylideneamino]imidazole-4-carboxamide isomerase [Acidimicrobiia bacterium]
MTAVAFELYPAIDLREGRCVRLYQGDYAQETVYDEDPVRVARAFADAGAPWIHVVDLDAARTGTATNLAVIEAICAAVPGKVQSGGGVRSAEAAEALLAAGVHRVVVGTAAIERPELVTELGARHPGGVAVGLDARGMEVAVRGWVEGSGADLVETARRFDTAEVAALVVTSIAVDGTLAGPDVEQLAAVLAATSVPVVASGGVGTLDDLRTLRALRVGDRSLAGVIAGKAIYEGRFTVTEALIAIE